MPDKPAIRNVWEWKGEGEAATRHPFNPQFDACATEQGIVYHADTQGPFCGYDRCGEQTWAEFLASGPPDEIGMPASISDEIRAFARLQKLG